MGFDFGAVVQSDDKKGKSPLFVVTEEEVARRTLVLPTGLDSFDIACGYGGLPVGRIVIFYGPPGCGKTSLALHCVGKAQKHGGGGIYFDFENKLDVQRYDALGVDRGALLMADGVTIEDATDEIIDKVEKLRAQDADAPIVIVWDSINSATSDHGTNKDVEKWTGLKEGLANSVALKRLSTQIAKHRVILIGVAHEKVVKDGMWTTKDKIGTGEKWHFAASQVWKWKEAKPYPPKGEPTGLKQVIENVKNQGGIPFRTADCYLDFETGYDEFYSAHFGGLSVGAIEARKSWYAVSGDEKAYAQGDANAIQALADDADLLARIRAISLTGGRRVVGDGDEPGE